MLAPSHIQKPFNSSISAFLMADDNAMAKQIEATHLPDGRDLDARPLLHIIEDILNRATITGQLDSTEPEDNLEEKSLRHPGQVSMLDTLPLIIDRISCEISCRCMDGADVHVTAISLLQMVATYSWDAKLVLTMAAFALNYGEFWLLLQIYTSNSLAKSMAVLKKVPSIVEQSNLLKPHFDALKSLIQASLSLTKCLVKIKELPPKYINNHDVAEVVAFKNSLPTAVYWTIRSILVCATQITTITNLGHQYATLETWDISTLTHKINNIYDHLKKQLEICYRCIEEKRCTEAFQMLRKLFEINHMDNMKVLKALIYSKDDMQPLVDGITNKRVNIEVLKRKTVLLLISDLNISMEEISILEQIYEPRLQAAKHENQYDIVWIPVFDPSMPFTVEMQKKFEHLRSAMPWYILSHPSLIDKSVARFIKEVWKFSKKPILVVIDPQGKVVCPNAIHMMWIWASNAFPFSSLREEALWREEHWRLELLVDAIDLTILNWIRDNKYILIYGGNDVEWIRKFTKSAREVAEDAKIPLEMVYVGKSGKKEQTLKIIDIVLRENLSSCWQEPAIIWFFWTRLECMLFSKIQQGKADDHDIITQEIKKLLSFDKTGGWAVLSRGSDILINGQASTFLATMAEYDLWKEQVTLSEFHSAIKEHYGKLHSATPPCCRFEFPDNGGRIPDIIRCPECLRMMEKYVTFICCHDEAAPSAIH